MQAASAFPLRLRPGIGILRTSVKKLKKPCNSGDLGQGAGLLVVLCLLDVSRANTGSAVRAGERTIVRLLGPA